MRNVPSRRRAQLVAVELERISAAMQRLREFGVIRSQKVVSDIGEWLAATLLDGRVAESRNQKAWDIICGVKQVQVRAHAKAEGNRNRFTPVADVCAGNCDLVIVVLSPSFLVQRLFHIPNREVKARAVNGRLSWARVADFEVRKTDVRAKGLVPLFALDV
jgi:hypothetical protein